MSRLPLRLKLTLVFAGAMALVLFGAGFFVHQRVAADLSRALDQELRSRAQDLSPLVLRGSSLRASRSGLLEHGEAFAEIISSDGRVVDSTAPIGTLRLIDSKGFERGLQGPVFVDRDSAPGLDGALAKPWGVRKHESALLLVRAKRPARARRRAGYAGDDPLR